MQSLPTHRAIWGVVWMLLMQTTCAFLVVPSFSVVQTRCTSLPAAQLLEFVEPETGVKVTLIGAMHYNPSSVRLAKETIDRLGKANQLGSVIVEACDIRWNKTAELYADKPILKNLLSNEMRIACDTAMDFDRPVVLGDQRINITVDSLKANLGATMTDLLTPTSLACLACLVNQVSALIFRTRSGTDGHWSVPVGSHIILG
jgi:hypothetical protein